LIEVAPFLLSLRFIVQDSNATLCWCDLKEEKRGFFSMSAFFHLYYRITVEICMEITTLKYVLLFTLYLSSVMLKAMNI